MHHNVFAHNHNIFAGGGDLMQQVQTSVPEVVVNMPEKNYWWLLALAIIPVVLTVVLRKR